MAVDIFSIKPSVINRSLSGIAILLAGAPKIGKSEFCAQSPKTLIFDMENGYKYHPGVTNMIVTKWSDIKLALRQLEKPEAKELYQNVAFDTIAHAWELCTKHICAQNGVQNIKDIPYGAGYKMRDAEFDHVLRTIINLNYGLILTTHVKEKIVDTQGDIDIISIGPDVDKRCLPIINGLVDVIGVIKEEWTNKGEHKRWLITKATPTITAGSRLTGLDPIIPFGYKNLEEAIGKAIDKIDASGEGLVVDKVDNITINEELNFNDVRLRAQQLWGKLVGAGDNADPDMARTILKKIEMIMGRQMKLSEFGEDQVDLLNLVVLDMEDMIKK